LLFPGIALAVSLGWVGPVAAEMTPCSLVTEAVVSQAIGGPVEGHADIGLPVGLDACEFIDQNGADFGVSRERNAFGAGEQGGAAALAQRYVPDLPEEAHAQISALSQAGMSIALPGYQIAAVGGVGDSAVWVKTELQPGSTLDSLIVQRGADAFAFDVDDVPDGLAQLTRLAQAVLSNVAP
jgi:hypothetical protein